eukprot:12156870-Heterocapsa_arctica.AAC.1
MERAPARATARGPGSRQQAATIGQDDAMGSTTVTTIEQVGGAGNGRSRPASTLLVPTSSSTPAGSGNQGKGGMQSARPAPGGKGAAHRPDTISSR